LGLRGADQTVRILRRTECALPHPVRPGEALVASGELVSNRRGKLFEAKGRNCEIRPALVLATASGKYLPIKQGRALRNMVTDFGQKTRVGVFGKEG